MQLYRHICWIDAWESWPSFRKIPSTRTMDPRTGLKASRRSSLAAQRTHNVYNIWKRDKKWHGRRKSKTFPSCDSSSMHRRFGHSIAYLLICGRASSLCCTSRSIEWRTAIIIRCRLCNRWGRRRRRRNPQHELVLRFVAKNGFDWKMKFLLLCKLLRSSSIDRSSSCWSRSVV